MVMSFVLSFFPRGVLGEILNLIESVSKDFPSYSSYQNVAKMVNGCFFFFVFVFFCFFLPRLPCSCGINGLNFGLSPLILPQSVYFSSFFISQIAVLCQGVSKTIRAWNLNLLYEILFK